MPRRLKIPHQQVPDLEVVRDVGSAKLDELAASLPGQMLRVSQLEDALKPHWPERAPAVALLLIQLTSMALADFPRAPANLIAELTQELRQTSSWTEAELETWTSVTAALGRLIFTPGLVTLAKAIRLQWDHANVLTETHIITDVRPVFDAEANSPVAAIICHTLKLSYTSEGRTHHISLALDTTDLHRLQTDAERALKKATVMKGYLGEPWALPTRVQGNEDAT